MVAGIILLCIGVPGSVAAFIDFADQPVALRGVLLMACLLVAGLGALLVEVAMLRRVVERRTAAAEPMELKDEAR